MITSKTTRKRVPMDPLFLCCNGVFVVGVDEDSGGDVVLLRSENGDWCLRFAVTTGRCGTGVRSMGGDWCDDGPVGLIFRWIFCQVKSTRYGALPWAGDRLVESP